MQKAKNCYLFQGRLCRWRPLFCNRIKCPGTKVKGWCDGGCASGIKYPSDEDGAVINRASSFFAAWVSKDFSDDEGFKENDYDDKLGMFTLLLFKHLCVTETFLQFHENENTSTFFVFYSIWVKT